MIGRAWGAASLASPLRARRDAGTLLCPHRLCGLQCPAWAILPRPHPGRRKWWGRGDPKPWEMQRLQHALLSSRHAQLKQGRSPAQCLETQGVSQPSWPRELPEAEELWRQLCSAPPGSSQLCLACSLGKGWGSQAPLLPSQGLPRPLQLFCPSPKTDACYCCNGVN